MKNNKEKYITEVFDSLKGSKRAKPNPNLFAKIENRIFGEEAKIIPITQWRMAAAAAVVILAMNIFAIQNFSQNNQKGTGGIITEESNQVLISNYNLYDL